MLPNLEFATIAFINFDLYISKGGMDMFAFIMNYLNEVSIPKHVNTWGYLK
jgi:hypothetical protein